MLRRNVVRRKIPCPHGLGLTRTFPNENAPVLKDRFSEPAPVAMMAAYRPLGMPRGLSPRREETSMTAAPASPFMDSSELPLRGIKVLELSHMIMGLSLIHI